jgi:hypothetical protein
MRMRESAGALIVWHDVPDDFTAELDAWYQGEHLHERLDLRGFRTARRYRALSGAARFLALYDVDRVGVLGSPPYRARLEQPTEWTRRVMPSFRNFVRCACDVVGDRGAGIGGILGVVVLKPGETPPLDEIVRRPGVMRARLLQADESVTRVPNPESLARPAPDALVERILIVEAITPEAANLPGATLYRLMCALP